MTKLVLYFKVFLFDGESLVNILTYVLERGWARPQAITADTTKGEISEENPPDILFLTY